MTSDIIDFPVDRTQKAIEEESDMHDDPVFQTILNLLDESGTGEAETGKPNDQIAKDIFRRFDLARKTREWIEGQENGSQSDKED